MLLLFSVVLLMTWPAREVAREVVRGGGDSGGWRAVKPGYIWCLGDPDPVGAVRPA